MNFFPSIDNLKLMKDVYLCDLGFDIYQSSLLMWQKGAKGTALLSTSLGDIRPSCP